MTTYGYARVSTTDQHLDAQIEQLTAAGCTVIYKEKASGTKAGADRPQLTAMLTAVQAGDLVVVCKIDRIARSTLDLLIMVKDMKARGVAFKALSSPIDTSNSFGTLMLQIIGAIAEFERTLLLERQQDGINRARAEGKYKGRVPTAQRRSEEVLTLLDLGFTRQAAADQIGISLASVYRIVRAAAAGGAICGK